MGQPVTGDLEEFATAHRAALLRWAVALCSDPAEAEDLVQGTYVQLLPRWHRVSRMEFPLAYARKVLFRLYLAQARPRESPVDLARGVGGQKTESHDGGIGQIAEVDAAVRLVQHLPPRARAVITLRYIEDLDDRTISRMLGISRSTVRVTAHQALRRLGVQTTTDSIDRKGAS